MTGGERCSVPKRWNDPLLSNDSSDVFFGKNLVRQLRQARVTVKQLAVLDFFVECDRIGQVWKSAVVPEELEVEGCTRRQTR